MMLTRLDAFILKRVFQPVANRVGRHFGKSCYWLAGHAAILGFAGMLGWGISTMIALREPVVTVAATSLVVAHFFYARSLWNCARRQDRQSLIAAAVPDQRFCKWWGVFVVADLPFLLIIGWSDIASTASAFGYFSFAYFMECNPRSPARKPKAGLLARLAPAMRRG